MDKLFNFIKECEIKGKEIKGINQLPDDLFEDRNVILGKAALQAKFHRKFSSEEVKHYIETEFAWEFVEISQWYKDKWFR